MTRKVIGFIRGDNGDYFFDEDTDGVRGLVEFDIGEEDYVTVFLECVKSEYGIDVAYEKLLSNEMLDDDDYSVVLAKYISGDMIRAPADNWLPIYRAGGLNLSGLTRMLYEKHKDQLPQSLRIVPVSMDES